MATMPLGRKILPAAGIVAAHLAPLGLLITGVRRQDWIAFALAYAIMLFAIGAGLHRYFAHRAFKTSRAFQFALGLLGSAVFGDPIGFAGKHRQHHKLSDTDQDVHSPRQGAWYCWVGHLLDDDRTEDEILDAARDLARYPELLWLHRYWYVPALAAAVAVLAFGGYSMFALGFCAPWCIVAIHGSAAVNYFCHRGGIRRFETPDRSTNRPVLGLVLFGEGWHNNHHYYPPAARSGFRWYEFDILFYILKLLSWLGLVWELRDAPASLRRPAPAGGGETCALP